MLQCAYPRARAAPALRPGARCLKGPMLKLAITLLFTACAACAGAPDMLPAIGSALNHLQSGYLTMNSVSTRAAAVAEAFCAPPVVLPQAVDACTELQSALGGADSLKAQAKQELDAANALYHVLNQAAGLE